MKDSDATKGFHSDSEFLSAHEMILVQAANSQTTTNHTKKIEPSVNRSNVFD